MSLVLSTRGGLFCFLGEGQSAYGEGQGFQALARVRESKTVYAGRVNGGVCRSDDGGRSWAEVGTIEGFEELSCLAVDPLSPDHLLAGMEPSALFHSRDGGRTWEEDPAIRRMSHENGWSVPWSDAKGHVRTIAIDLNDSARVYLAIEVGGVVRSEDGGRHWENVHGGIHDDVHSVTVHPRTGSILYAATRHGLGRSDDYGKSWRPIGTFEGQGYARAVVLNPDRPARLYTAAATTGPDGFKRPVGSECGIFRSDDGGLSWERLTKGIPAHFKPYVEALDVDPKAPEHVALADAEGHLYQSDDGGDTWSLSRTLPSVRRLVFSA
jgi:photosystem II stability/assembly factor-like uncharacterized protein